MASDYPPGEAGNPQTAFSVSHTVRDVAAGQAVFDRLLQHGAAVVPYGPTFWASGFGMVKDRFGTHWMITTPGPA
jgi:PhnB protein